MKKEFKRNVGDEVWVIFEDKPQLCYISKMFYFEFISNVSYELIKSEIYSLMSKSDGRYLCQFESKDVFDTKEDLIKSL